MTREEIKLINVEDIDKLFGSLWPKGEENEYLPPIVEYYPILCDNQTKNRYELKGIYIYKTDWKLHIMEGKLAFWEYIDELFNKYNIVELLTDIDDSMNPSTVYKYSMLADINTLKKKYPYKDIVYAGYLSFHNVDKDTGELIGKDI